MRKRTDNKYGPPTAWALTRTRSNQNCSGTWTESQDTPYSGTHVETSTLKSMDDIVTPEFNKKKAMGRIVNNPMSQSTIISYDLFCDVDSLYGIQIHECSPKRWRVIDLQHFVGPYPTSSYLGNIDTILPSPPAVDEQQLIDLAVNQAWANTQLDEATALVTVAESQKTIASLTAIFSRFLKILRSLKRLKARELLREFSGKELADRYMELRYALRPLVYDYNSVVSALQTQTKPISSRLTFRGHKSDIERSTVVDPSWVWQTHQDSYGTFVKGGTRTETTSTQVDVRAGVLTSLQTESKLPVWGLTTPIEAAWELVPFSFIIDWFFNVGDTIAAWTPNFGLSPLASWYVVTTTVEQHITVTDTWATAVQGTDPNRKPYAHTWDVQGMQIGRTTVTKTRVPTTSRTVIPRFSPNLDLLKLTDLLIIGKKLLR